MKFKSSVLYSLLLLLALAGCGKEQFGGAPQSSTEKPSGVNALEQLSCSSYTLIKPKVDILYVVDNSTSTYYVADDIKNAIKGTVDRISSQFDYRVIGTNLLVASNDPNPYTRFQYLTNSSDAVNPSAGGEKIIKSNQFDFFDNKVSGASEPGLKRTIDFMQFHTGTGLLRQGAYHLVVLISNGRDTDIETPSPFGPSGAPVVDTNVLNSRFSSFVNLKTQLQSTQLRLISVTAHSACKSGWFASSRSYKAMSNMLYTDSGAKDSESSKDAYNLCSGAITSIFTNVNKAIKQVVLPHTYQYWPITFTNSDNIDIDKIKVYVSSPSSAPSLLDESKWDYHSNPNRSAINTRTLPSPGEPSSARHMIKFTPGNEIVYPNCVSVTSTTKTEYFGYVVTPREPKVATIVLRINGVDIPKSDTNGWSYIGNATRNIKVAYPNPGDELPPVNKSGYMIQLNGSGNYYKSGDSVEVFYVGEGI